MDKDEVCRRVVALIERDEPLPVESLENKLDYRYLDSGHIDSFAIIDFIFELEDTFKIQFTAEDTQSDQFRTPRGVILTICGYLSI